MPCWGSAGSARRSCSSARTRARDRAVVRYPERYSDDVFVEARDWLRGLLSGEPEA